MSKIVYTILASQDELPGQVEINWLEGGNHDLRPLKKQGLDENALIDQAAVMAADFIRSLG